MNALANAICSTGIAVWNIEYRRVGRRHSGWPVTFQDVASAVDYLATVDSVDQDRIFTCGHSAGGHLALWAAGRIRASSLWTGQTIPANPLRVRGALSLAGVSDLGEAATLDLGNGAVVDFLGGSPASVPTRYAEGSPVAMLPLGVHKS